MNATIRERVKNTLSPDTLNELHHYRWLRDFYLPRSVSSLFTRLNPKILMSCGGGSTKKNLELLLQEVNLLAPTKMCRVMTKHGSDKGRGWHNYTTVYSALLGKRRHESLAILELGLGTNNLDYLSNMGVHGRPGASLRGWRELFPYSRVYGADIDCNILFKENGIKTFYCDQLNEEAIEMLWSQPDLRDGCDIIIEDGLHTFEANISFLQRSLGHLRAGGFYVIEDILNKDLAKWPPHIKTAYAKMYPNCDFVLVSLPNPINNYDNNLLLIFRNEE